MNLKLAAGDTSLEMSNTLKLSRGIIPHGYSQMAPHNDQYVTVARRLERVSNNLDGTIELVEKMNCELTRARRDFEQISCLIQANLPE